MDEKSLAELMEAVPPVIARMISPVGYGSNRRMRTIEQITRDSGLSRRTVLRLIWRESWRGIDFETAGAYLSACGVEIRSPFNHEQLQKFLKEQADNNFPLVKRDIQRKRLFAVIGS